MNSHHHSVAPSSSPLVPPALQSSLDTLVDRLNAASGYIAPSPSQPLAPIRVLLLGTNEGVGLTRSYGSGDARHASPMSEEVISSVESAWSTLPSSSPPHVMAAAAEAAAAASDGEGGGCQQPPHPLLRPLGLGNEVKTVTAFYDNVTLVHVHMAPLVVTILATPTANVGSIRSTALPLLRSLLEPLRQSLLTSRTEALQQQAQAQAAAAAQQQRQLQMQQQQQQGGGVMIGGVAGMYGQSMMMGGGGVAGGGMQEYYQR